MTVSPNSQGQGISSALLQPVLSQASHEGLPCYLVTFTKRALRFYQRNGFTVLLPNGPCVSIREMALPCFYRTGRAFLSEKWLYRA